MYYHLHSKQKKREEEVNENAGLQAVPLWYVSERILDILRTVSVALGLFPLFFFGFVLFLFGLLLF